MQRIRHTSLVSGFFLAFCLSVSGCATHRAEEGLTLSPESLEHRQLQTRKFEGISEKDMLIACAGVLQDLGFVLDETESDLGLIVASKKRDATDAKQVAMVIFLALLGIPMEMDQEQSIRVSLVSRPVSIDSDDSYFVRITFQRIVWTDQKTISKREPILEPIIYQEFYEKLSKSIFLEAQKI